jgi:hypothetical protein
MHMEAKITLPEADHLPTLPKALCASGTLL